MNDQEFVSTTGTRHRVRHTLLWKQFSACGGPDNDTRNPVVQQRVRELLADVYTPEGIEIWQPRTLLVIGGDSTADVLAEAERVAGAM